MLVDIRRPSTPIGPPPSYEVAVGSVETPARTLMLPHDFGETSKRNDPGLPSYERAIQMQSIGHV